LALITLGAGNINDISDVQATFVECVRALGSNWEPIVTSPPIAERSGRQELRTLSVFPLARYARAFDFAVSATGYNSFHEWIGASLPTIWIPNQQTVTDDQAARGAFAASAGLGLTLQSPTRDSIREAVVEMSRESTRLEMASVAAMLRKPNGAVAAADAIWALLEDA
jgi:UDP:flavonoid glycosyltransferase YjiC (YdhE family)